MMEEKRLQHIKWFVAGLLLITLIVGSVYVLDSKNLPGKHSVPSTDPETGVQMWIEAMNQRNIDRVYDFAPDEIKEQRTLAQFKEDNRNNTFLKPEYSFINYSVTDKKQNGTYAQIVARVFLQQPETQKTPGLEVPLYYKFDLYNEHGEWKTWMDPETGIQMWIEAVNEGDIDRLYDLAPDEIKEQRTLAQFKVDNLNNTFLQPGNYFINYNVIDKQQNATYAEIIAQVFFHQPANQQNTPGTDIPIQYKFALYYQHGEWKIWTLKW